LIVLVFPLLVNALTLTNVLKAAPVLRDSNLRTASARPLLAGFPKIDPNNGVTSEALGKRSADEWLQGKIPWWNSDTGVGLPLAGEMQPAPFFPLTLLEELPNGQTIVDVVVEIFAGAFTFLLLRRLGVRTAAGVAGALLVECNGTCAWLGAEWCYPLPMLPLLIYGVELCLAPALRERILGSAIVAVAVAVSITSAMIEIAYLNGLLAVGWALLRLAQARGGARVDGARVEGALRMGLGALLGLAITAPPLIAFIDYLKVSYVGIHAASVAGAHLNHVALLQTLLPYVWGPIFNYGNGAIFSVWASVGGYAGVALVLLAICGLFGSPDRGLRVLLGLWVLVTYSATIGVPHAGELVSLVPGVKITAYFRYFDGSREFALALLVALFLNDLIAGQVTGRVRYAVATVSVALVLLIGLALSRHIFSDVFALAGFKRWFWASISEAVVAIAAIWAAASVAWSPARRAYALGAIVVLEAALNYTIPTLANPHDAHIGTGFVGFFKAHLGLQRIYSLGPLNPNYAAYFDVAAIDHNQLPVAKSWTDYVHAHLDPYVDPVSFTGDVPSKGDGVPGRDEVLRANLAAFEGVGVKYVLSYPGARPLQTSADVELAPAAESGGESGAQAGGESGGQTGARLQLHAAPAGLVTAVGLPPGSYTATPGGALELEVCAEGRCARARRAFTSASNAGTFVVELDRPLRVLDGDVSLATRVPDARTFAAGAATTIRLFYNSTQAEVPSFRRNDRAVSAFPGESIRGTIAGAEVPTGVADAVGVFQENMQGPAGAPLAIRICSAGRCSHGERNLGNVAGATFLWFALDRPLRLDGGTVTVSFELGGSAPHEFWIAPEPAGTDATVAIGDERLVDQGFRLSFDFPGTAGATRLVYSDDAVDVDELPAPAPYFAAAGCTLGSASRERVDVRCAHASTLIRRELYMPGWTAAVNGAPAKVTPTDEIFQAVSVGAGNSTVTFDFTPPRMEYGYAAFTLGLLSLLYQLFAYARLRLRNETPA
jgi:hypothetical protein